MSLKSQDGPSYTSVRVGTRNTVSDRKELIKVKKKLVKKLAKQREERRRMRPIAPVVNQLILAIIVDRAQIKDGLAGTYRGSAMACVDQDTDNLSTDANVSSLDSIMID